MQEVKIQVTPYNEQTVLDNICCKRVEVKNTFRPRTAVEPLASVMSLLLCLRSTVLRQRKAPRYNLMVRALSTRQTGRGLCLEGDAVYELLLVPSLAPNGFSLGPAIFPSHKKNIISNNLRSGGSSSLFLKGKERPISSNISKF